MLHRKTHPTDVDGCFGCKILGLNLSTGEASSRVPMTTKKWDAELQAYRDARAQGIQPASTRMRDIQTAVEVSNRAGKAFKADDSTGGLI
jgi:hypothetical protein